MTRTSFTSYYSQLFVIFIWHHISQNCSHLGEVGASEHFVYHAKGMNLISVTGHDLRQGLSLVHIGKTLRRKWFFSMFFITHATFFTIVIIVIISFVIPLCLSIFTFSLHNFPKIYFQIPWLLTYFLIFFYLWYPRMCTKKNYFQIPWLLTYFLIFFYLWYPRMCTILHTLLKKEIAGLNSSGWFCYV